MISFCFSPLFCSVRGPGPTLRVEGPPPPPTVQFFLGYFPFPTPLPVESNPPRRIGFQTFPSSANLHLRIFLSVPASPNVHVMLYPQSQTSRPLQLNWFSGRDLPPYPAVS